MHFRASYARRVASAAVRSAAAGVLAAGVLAAGVAHAQFTPQRAAQGTFRDAAGAVVQCGSATAASGPGVSEAACRIDGPVYRTVNYFARGRTEGGAVGASVSMGAGDYGPGFGQPGRGWEVSASGQWADRLTFRGPAPASVRMDLFWDGFLSAQVSAAGAAVTGFSSTAQAAWGFTAAAGATPLVRYADSAAVSAVSASVPGGSGAFASRPVAATQSFLIPVGAATPFLDFLFDVRVVGSVAIAGGALGVFGGGTINGDFGSTGRITRLAFYDAAGQDVTGSVTYSFANGTRVYPLATDPPPTTVPEPGPLALLVAGLAAVGAGARVRRGAAR